MWNVRFVSFLFQDKIFHFNPLTQYIFAPPRLCVEKNTSPDLCRFVPICGLSPSPLYTFYMFYTVKNPHAPLSQYVLASPHYAVHK